MGTWPAGSALCGMVRAHSARRWSPHRQLKSDGPDWRDVGAEAGPVPLVRGVPMPSPPPGQVGCRVLARAVAYGLSTCWDLLGGPRRRRAPSRHPGRGRHSEARPARPGISRPFLAPPQGQTRWIPWRSGQREFKPKLSPCPGLKLPRPLLAARRPAPRRAPPSPGGAQRTGDSRPLATPETVCGERSEGREAGCAARNSKMFFFQESCNKDTF